MLCVVALRDVLPWVLCVVLCARVRECVASLSLCVCVLFVRARDALSVIACACVCVRVCGCVGVGCSQQSLIVLHALCGGSPVHCLCDCASHGGHERAKERC